MAVTNPFKIVDKTKVGCGEIAKVTLSFESKSELIENPADIILIIDKSSSMVGEKMEFAKTAVRDFIDMVSVASDGIKGQMIGNDSRLALVSFSDDANIDISLTNNVMDIENSLDNLIIGGMTNHYSAFLAASRALDYKSNNDKIIVMFTDGVTTTGKDANTITDKLKIDGVEIFCIGLVDNSDNLENWASTPKKIHMVSSNDILDLGDLFKKISYEVIKAGAKEISLTETLNDVFKIHKVYKPSIGNIEVKSPQTFVWKIDAVGLTKREIITCSFDIVNAKNGQGIYDVNDSLIYKDRDNNELNFISPKLELDCKETIIIPDSAIANKNFQIEGCKDAKSIDVEETGLKDLGRIIQVNVKLKSICPGKRVGLGVILTETTNEGIEFTRGLKTILVPALNTDTCKDIEIKCINFVIPEELNGEDTNSICNDRNFKVRIYANYIDTDYISCDANVTILK